MRKNGPLHYLASPYTDPDPSVQEQRYQMVRALAARLFAQRIWVFAPIVHCHDISISHGLPGDFEFWDEYDRTMLYHCDDMWIAPLPGWEDSRGIKAEREICADYNMPVYKVYATDDTFTLERLLNVKSPV